MLFTSLRLYGFKSFVDPTELVIADGLTGIVGPNGCGKSNLLEALRWVMGESRAKVMRGAGMDDVIFNGTSARPARSFAEVTLGIDNSERLAPAGFNDADQLQIVRRITRDAGSAYRAAGKDVRARDVQMLFADASTGAHSPALVRQGQISELVNARPKARRRVLEEAAGISGLYQRRHEAELKLNATLTNLARVDDVLDNLSTQLGQLERQAKAAARYRTIAEALRAAEGALLYRRWAEADAVRRAADAARSAALAAAQSAISAANAAEQTAVQCEEALPPLREEDNIAAAVLQRTSTEAGALAEKEERAEATIRDLDRQFRALCDDLAREEALEGDATAQMQSLRSREAQLRSASDGHEAELARRDNAAQTASAEAGAAEGALEAALGDLARAEARNQAVTQRAEAAVKAKTQAERTLEEARTAETRSAQALSAGAARASDAALQAQQAADQAAQDEKKLTQAEEVRAQAASEDADARAAHAEADGTRKMLAAEHAALGRMLKEARGAGASLIDEVSAAPGYEAALGAVLGEDLAAPRAEGDLGGWTALPDYAAPQPLPEGATPLAAHVTGPAELTRRLAQIGLVEDGAGLQAALLPGQRLVNRAGDLWRWDGLQQAAGAQLSGAARLLEQRNRLAVLGKNLLAAEATAQETGAARDRARAVADAAAQAEQQARTARKASEQAATRAARAASDAEAKAALERSRADAAKAALERASEEAQRARDLAEEAERERAALGEIDGLRTKVEGHKIATAAARAGLLEAKGALEACRRAEDGRQRGLSETARQLRSWEKRLASADERKSGLVRRRDKLETDLSAARGEPAQIRAARTALAEDLARAEARRKAALEALGVAETAQKEAASAAKLAAQRAAEAGEARGRADAHAEAASQTAEVAAEQIAQDLEQTPEALGAGLGAVLDTLATAAAAEAETQKLRRQRDNLGAVNLRAEEDARTISEEHDSLAREKADTEAAVAKLRGGIESLNREGRARLLRAFDEVNRNFTALFKHLFGGGDANLVLVESDDPLEAGLEIMCQPPGKKLATLSLLSGGEQTLTALSLIFAVFLANPAPICVLDEVDAPLDDANVGRFCDLLDEMTERTRTRFLIITHHAVTMARMDRLFGVTMVEQGVSQLVSVDLSEAEGLVA